MFRNLQAFAAVAGTLLVSSILSGCGGSSSVAPPSLRTDQQLTTGSQLVVRPLDAVFRYTGPISSKAALPLWHGSFTYKGTAYHYIMVGTNPATSNVATTVPVEIIPIKVVIGTHTFDPSTKLSDGKTVTEQVVASPIFKKGIDFKQGGVDLGSTQFPDAFQRGNFWGKNVSHNTGYHVLLGGPTVLSEVTMHPPPSQSEVGTAFGVTVGAININYFDAQLQSLITKLGISPATVPLFLTTQVYLLNGPPPNGPCCIGGYHFNNGTNTYMHATFINKSNAFSADVGALSHEMGEWVDDPFNNNSDLPAACGGGNLEVGDPLENDPNFGYYTYTLGGFTYHLQDLVFLPYFGAPASTSVNGWKSFQNAKLTSVCQNGP